METVPEAKPEKGKTWNALSLAFELGYTIAIPIVVFAFAGRVADRTLGTSPWLLLLGILLSIVLSTALIYRKVSRFL